MKENSTRTLMGIPRMKLLLIFFSFFISILGVQAQVTIGDGTPPQKFSILEIVSNSKGGMRLPQLSTSDRDAITDAAFKANALAEGLSIFNTTTKCYEYWNATRWVSLCKGDANIIFKDNGNNIVDPFATDYPCAGETRGAFTPHDSEPCVGMPAAFDFLVMIGDSYTSFNVINPATGEFELTMNPNPTARNRNAVLRITNNCTGEYKEFLFMQEGCTSVCQPGVAQPVIKVSNAGAICSTGAVYMYIDNADPAASYIWTLNDVEISDYTGKPYCAATQNGNYKVYVGGIGCDMNASVTHSITINGTSTAPAAVGSITASNNGVICSTADVKLTAYSVPGTGTLTWYKDGQKTTRTGNPISLRAGDEGDWFAVMEAAACTSKPSNTISVTYDANSTPIVDPEITVNGVPLASATFCQGGHTILDIANLASYTNAVTVTWYDGTTPLGTGTPFAFSAPTSSLVLRCVVHDNTGAFCDAEVIAMRTISGTAPTRPSISGNPFICGGSPALLSTSAVGASFKWFHNGVEITGANTNNYSATLTGQYQVQVVGAGGCLSPLSVVADVKLSAFPTVAFTLPQTEAEPSSIVTYQVSATQNPTSYVWTVTSPSGKVILLDGNNPNTQNSTTTGSSMRVQMGTATEHATLTCRAVNNCGNSPEISHQIDIKPACTPVQIGNVTMTPTGNILAGTGVSMSVTATGTTPYTYQWKRNGADIAGATNATYSFTAATADNGTYTVEVGGCNSSTATGTAGTINVFDTSTMPTGSGKLTGKDCFDINQSNFNSACGLQAQRQTADFTKAYTYTFTSTGTGNSDLTWLIDELPAGAIIDYSQSTITDRPGSLTNGGTYTITIKYKPSLMTDAKGTTDANAFKANIYAIYKTGTNFFKQQLEVTIKDCRCGCGAMTTSGTWLAFMCHNLGADETLDPFTPDPGLYGDLYQWGRPKDGHQLRTSGTTSALATSNVPGHSNFILSTLSTYSNNYDWRQGGGNTTRWGDGTTNENQVKATNDPCPTGWKVPSQKQWASIYTNHTTPNTWTWTTSGYKVGDGLFLPAAVYRDVYYGTLYSVGINGYYWSSTIYGTNSYYLYFHSGNVGPAYKGSRGYGFSVRCVQE